MELIGEETKVSVDMDEIIQELAQLNVISET